MWNRKLVGRRLREADSAFFGCLVAGVVVAGARYVLEALLAWLCCGRYVGSEERLEIFLCS